MAEVAVQLFLPKLVELLEKEVDLLAGVRDDVCLLRHRLQWIQSFLKDADAKSNKDDRIKLWVTQIRDAAIDAEDIIDEYQLKTEQRHHHHDRKARFLSCIRKPFRKPIQWRDLYNIGQKIKTINTRLEGIKENASAYGMTPGAEGQGSSSSRENRRRPIIEEASYGLVGIDKDANEVAKLLVEGETRRSVVSIFGMGGVGKTTLAKYVYNCKQVKRHFECFAWITVSQEFRVHDLLSNAINCITGTEMEELRPKDEKDLREKLLQCLKGKVYLVVLDDMWEIDAWNSLVTSFPNEANGSRILITTRNKDLALQVDPLIGLYELRFRTEDECWELLCKKAFPSDPHECPPHLKEEGKKIVEKCRGLPLAVVVLGGLLSRNQQTIHEWRKVLESIGWQLSQSNHQISSILALSYNDLPYHLKPCFLHFTCFPEDKKVRKHELIHMWVAEGFIEGRGSETLEDIAEDYLLDLTDRSMIQLAERNIHDQEVFSMHDLLRDIGIRKAKEERFLDVYVNADSVAPTTARRLAITHHDIKKAQPLQLSKLTNIQTMWTVSAGDWIKDDLGKMTSLRTLGIHGVMTSYQDVLFESIGRLENLRSLQLEFKEGMVAVPIHLSHLVHLEKLDLKGQMEALPPLQDLIANLTYLKLENSMLKQDPMAILEKLPKLRSLGLQSNCYIGKKMSCNAQGFPELESYGFLRWRI